MADANNLNAAVSAAFDGWDSDEGTEAEASEAPESAVDTPEDATEGAQPDVETKDDGEADTEATDPAGDEGTEEPPTRYFEVDLSGLPAEERARIIESLKGRDDTIGKLLRGRAEGDTEADKPAEVNEPEPITDDAILQAFGLDPENPFDETASKVALPLVRGLQALQDQVAALTQDRELQALDAYWTSELDKLEAANGELPVDRTAVLEFAAQNGLNTPDVAYWTIAGPAKRQVEQAVAAAQARVAGTVSPKPGKKEVASARPKSSGADTEVPVEGQSLRDSVKDATSKVLRDLGIS